MKINTHKTFGLHAVTTLSDSANKTRNANWRTC